MGQTKVGPIPEGTPHFDSPHFCEVKTVFRLKIEWKLAKGQGFFKNFFPIEILFVENFQNYRRQFPKSSFDREFNTEKLYNGTFFDKMNMWRDMTYDYDVTNSLKMR